VAHADLMPTLLDLAGVATPAHATGRSLAVLLDPAGQAREPGEALIVSEAWGIQLGGPAPALAARQGRFKLMRSKTGAGFVDALFDLDADARERSDLGRAGARALDADAAAARARLAAALDAHEAEAELTRRAMAGAVGREEGGDAAPLPLDPDREAKLRALGYIE
jgi:arylsulfatase A-like enzyme